MLNNFFKFFTVVFLLAMFLFPQNSFAQTVFTENFDGAWTVPSTLAPAWSGVGTGNQEWHRNDFTTGWTSTSGSYTPTGALSTTNSARFHTYDVTSGLTGSIITPVLDFSGYANSKLLYFYHLNTSGTDVVKVYLSVDGGTTYGSALATIGVSAAWTQYMVNLGTTTSSTVTVKFEATSDYGVTDIGIDQMSIVNIPIVPLVGGTTYPINGTELPPTSFATITSSLTYMALHGVTGSGQVYLELSPGYGVEPGPVTIGPITGTSATLGVTFRPTLGYTASTSIAGLASPNQFAIALNGCQYVTIDGQSGGTGGLRNWTIACTGSSNGQSAIRFLNTLGNTSNNTIRYCNLIAEATGTTSAIVAMTVGTSPNLYQNNIIEYNLIESGATIRGYAVSFGYSATGQLHTGNILRFNQIRKFNDNGIRITGTVPGLEVYNNDIYFAAVQTTGTALTGIYFSSTSSNVGAGVKIYNNKIYDLQTSTSTVTIRGFYQFSSAFTGSPVQFYNNFIALGNGTTTNATIYGIEVNTSATGTATQVYFNSVYLSGSITAGAINSMCYRRSLADLVADVRDNIFHNARTNAGGTGVHWAVGLSSTSGGPLNFNDYWTSGTGGVLGTTDLLATGNKTTLALWKAAVTTDASSISEDPDYTAPLASPPDLKINTATPTQLESGGVTIAGITSDFEGNPRLSPPDIGADEFAGTPLDLIPPVIVYTPLSNTGSTLARTIVVNVTDVGSGVPIVTPGWPNLYWKKNLLGTYSAVTPSSVAGSDYTYDFGAGVAVGDTVYYYVVAQDTKTPAPPNVGAYPSAGAGGFTYDPPAAATPPTTPSKYIIYGAPLSGNLTVGTSSFNQVTGLNIYFEKVVTKVMKEVEVEVPVENTNVEKGKESLVNDVQASFKAKTITKLMEVEEINWVPMQDGKPYLGELYVKKSEYPEFNYPEGTDAVYATITAAINDLNLRGVSGALNFLLVDATYPSETYPLVVNIQNPSLPTSVNTVTFKPNTGVTSLIQGAAASGQIFKILNSYVSIDGSNSGGTGRNLTIENTSATFPNVVVFGSTGTTPIVGNTLKNCILINGVTSSSAVVVSDGASIGTAGYFNNITIQNNSIRKAYMGVFNNAVVSAGNGSGLLITGNSLYDVSPNHIALVGLYVQGVDGATVSNNTIGRFTTTYTSNITGIWFATGTINSTISNNTIDSINITTTAPRGIVVTSGVANANVTLSGNNVSRMITSYSTQPYGIWVFSTTTGVVVEKNNVTQIHNTNSGGYGARGIYVSTGQLTNNITIRNNFVSEVRATADASSTYWGIGIGIEGATSGVEVYANNVNLFGSYAGYSSATVHAAFAIITSTANTLNVRDNIFVNTFDNTSSATDKSYAINTQTDSLAFTDINYNDYYVSGAPGVLGFRGVDRADLAAWQLATGKDANSISGDPHFMSDTDLHINAAYNTVSNNGQYIASVTTDYDGNARSVTTPDIGADEYIYVAPTVDDPTDVAANATSDTQINVAFTPNTSADDVVIVYNLTGTFTAPTVPPVVGQQLAGGEVLAITLSSPYNHSPLTGSTPYYYKLFSYDGANYSPGVTASATTFITPLAPPFTQDFEGTFPPLNWTQALGLLANPVVFTTGTQWFRDDYLNVTSPTDYSAKINVYGTTRQGWLMTPTINLGNGSTNYQLEFDLGMTDFGSTNPPDLSGTDDKFAVVISTDGGTTWTSTNTLRLWDNAGSPYVYNSITNSTTHVILNLTGYTGIVKLGFYGESTLSNADNDLFVDDVEISLVPTVPIFAIDPISKDYGTIFVGNSVSQNFTISNDGVGTLTINNGGITLIGTNANQFILGSISYPINLTAGQSVVVPVTFTPTSAGAKSATLQIVHNAAGTPAAVPLTGSALPSGILFEDFTGTTFPPAGWTVVNNDGGTTSWFCTTTKSHSPPASAQCRYESSTLENDDWLITPKLVVNSGDSIAFWYSAYNYPTEPEELYIQIGTTNDPNTGTWDTLGHITYGLAAWAYESYDLSAYAGQQVYIAFISRGLYMWYLHIDDVLGPQVYVPAVDLAFTNFYQSSGFSPFKFSKETDGEKHLNTKPLSFRPGGTVGVHSSTIDWLHPISYEGKTIPFNLLANIGIKGVIENFGLNAASYTLNWSVGGSTQTPYNGPSVLSNAADTANLNYSTTAIGTFMVSGDITVTSDENLSNNDATPFRMRVYPDVYTQTIFDDGDDISDTYIGYNDLTFGMKAGVRFTAPASDVKLAGVDYYCRTEVASSGIWQIQVRDTSSSSGAPGAVLYQKFFTASDYFSGAGDMIFFPFDNNAPVISAGDEYWITIKAPVGIAFPGGADTELDIVPIVPGHSYIEDNPDTTLWYALILSGPEEFAWVMRPVEVAAGPSTFPLTVTVTNGWNMVSVPGLHPTNQNVLTWWPLKDPAANVFKFVPGTGYDTTTTVTPGKGYWLKNLGAYTYTYPAIQIVAHDPINGSAGWNMIGGYEQNVLTSGITTNPPGLINAIVYGYRSDSGYVRAYDIVRGKGYWIKLSASGQIIIPSLLAKGTSKIAITNTKEWGRIIITDNAGRSYTLYAVKGGVNLNDYELPPPAPAGMFDVRYSSGRYAEELSAANQIIEMNGMEYPVRVRVENANIRLQDETGKINERMKPGEEVVINSNMISKLLVSTDIIPDKYSLEQNYPNPFNPSTRIEFSIPEDVNNVTLTIYDALGQRVAELVNTKMEAGKYSYVWNASNVATGLYIYELRTDKFVSVKKMMLLK